MQTAVSVVQKLDHESSCCGSTWMLIIGGRSSEKGTGWSKSFAQFRNSLELASRPVTVSQKAPRCDVLAASRTSDR